MVRLLEGSTADADAVDTGVWRVHMTPLCSIRSNCVWKRAVWWWRIPWIVETGRVSARLRNPLEVQPRRFSSVQSRPGVSFPLCDPSRPDSQWDSPRTGV